MNLRLVANETALAVLPAAVVLGLAATLHLLSPGAALSLFMGAILIAAIMAAWRARAASRFQAWLKQLADKGGGDVAPPALGGPLAEFAEPAADLVGRLRASERRLSEQGRRLATIIAAVPDPILLLDRTLTIRLSNPAADRTFALALRDLPLARALRDPGVLAAVNAATATGSFSNVTFSPVTDRMKQFAARVAPIELSDGHTGVLLALREQTEQVIIERMRSDFVANASHEIRTPLSAIVGVVETLQGPARKDEQATDMFLAMLAGEAKRMQRLVDDLLSLSRAELVAHQPPEDIVHPGEVAAAVARRMQPIAERAQSSLELAIDPNLPCVKADPDQLHQLLTNLVDNAIKYGRAGKPVRIEVQRQEAAPADAGPVSGRPCIVLRVIDHGEGIAPEHLPRLTERFYRVDKARSRRIGGTGLGLALVKHIIRRHQGHLTVTSELGRGSRFAVFLPEPEAAVPAIASSRAHPT